MGRGSEADDPLLLSSHTVWHRAISKLRQVTHNGYRKISTGRLRRPFQVSGRITDHGVGIAGMRSVRLPSALLITWPRLMNRR